MVVSPYLHVAMPYIEKLADLFVLLLPIDLLTSLGTVQGRLACSTVLEHNLRRCYGATDDAALRHDGLMLELS
jgi:lauroyl/myristoyl acyltransferase